MQSGAVRDMDLSSTFFSYCKSVKHLWCRWSYYSLYKLQICFVPEGTFMEPSLNRHDVYKDRFSVDISGGSPKNGNT